MDAYLEKKHALAKKFLEAAEEEDVAVYSLSLLLHDPDQLELFGNQRRQVQAYIDTLIEDTEKHRDLLYKIAQRLVDPRSSLCNEKS